jgi:Na+/proline symporter
LTLDRICVAGVTVGATATAYLGEDAYEMLEGAYELGLVSLLVPLLAGLHGERADERAALTSMAVGTGLWLVHVLLGWEVFVAPLGWALPRGLCCAVMAGIAYAVAGRRQG